MLPSYSLCQAEDSLLLFVDTLLKCAHDYRTFSLPDFQDIDYFLKHYVTESINLKAKPSSREKTA